MTKKNFDVARDIVVVRILEELEQGIIPWHKPWFGAGGAYSYSSGRPYGCVNSLLLGDNHAYITTRELKKLGGELKDGVDWKENRKQIVMYWIKTYTVKDENGEAVLDENGKEKTRKSFSLRYENVIDAELTTLPKKKRDRRPPARDRQAEDVIKAYVEWSGVNFQEIASDRAFYRPTTDEVVVPLIGQFKETSEFYSTVFHELSHSTGAMTRLKRLTPKELRGFGSEPYAREELVAELSACILNNWCDIATEKSDKNTVAYLQGWSKAIKDDPNMFVVACARADKASQMIIDAKGLL